MKIYILRHGQTDMNEQKRIQGMLDIDLNDTGISQAYGIRDRLNESGIKFDKVYTSPLKRARDTCEIVTGLRPGEYTVDDRLREISFGSIEGTGYNDLPGDKRAFFKAPERYVPDEKGEPIEDMIARATDFLEEVRRTAGPDDRILVVSHGTLIHGMLVYFRGKEIRDFWNEDIHNCDVIVAEVRDGRYQMTDEKYEVPHTIKFDYLFDRED